MLQGDVGEANTDVTQIVKLFPVGGAKWNWLLNNIVQYMSAGSVLVFVTKKVRCRTLHHFLDKKFYTILDFLFYMYFKDCLCGLVVRVLDYRSGGLGSIPGTTRKKK
jgi:hypothetical protein